MSHVCEHKTCHVWKESTKRKTKKEKDRVVHLKDDRRSYEGRAHGVVDLLHRNHFTKGYLGT